MKEKVVKFSLHIVMYCGNKQSNTIDLLAGSFSRYHLYSPSLGYFVRLHYLPRFWQVLYQLSSYSRLCSSVIPAVAP